jgi:hypothetical protein
MKKLRLKDVKQMVERHILQRGGFEPRKYDSCGVVLSPLLH